METAQVTNMDERGQTKLEYYDLKMKYKNLKNEVFTLEKKKKIYNKHDVPMEEKESLNNEINVKHRDLEQAKALYKEKKSQRMREFFHRSA